MARSITPAVRAAVDALFGEADRPAVLRHLQRYYGIAAARVHLSILVLSAGVVDEVAAYVQDANQDPRDVLFWSEYDGMPDRADEFADRYHMLRPTQQSNP